MNSISIVPGPPKTFMQQPIGFNGISLAGNTKQFLEAQFGFKGITLHAEMGGSVQIIKHYR